MASDSDSVNQRVLDFTEAPCGICGPSTQDEEMIGCDGCSAWFHSRCINVVSGKLPKKWFCQNADSKVKAEEYRKQREARKQQRSRKEVDESDKSSVNSRLGASNVEAKVRALEERQKRLYEEMEAEQAPLSS